MSKEDLCKLKDARAYVDGLMEEVQEDSPAWGVLNEAWCLLDGAIKKHEN